MFMLTFILMFMNYQRFIIPEWLLQLLTICMLTFQMISVVGYGYCATKTWETLTQDDRLTKSLYFGLLVLVTVLTADLTRRIVFHNSDLAP
jgi:hypothetical protein